MVQIALTMGGSINIPDEAIALITGPYPHDVGPYTYIHAAGPGVIVTLEPPSTLIGRLQTVHPFAILTRPDQSSVWIKAEAVTLAREPYPEEFAPDLPNVRCVLMIGLLRQAITQDRAAAVTIIDSYGGHIS